MIRILSGTVLSVDSEMVCLDVSGFGLEIFASGSLLASAHVGEALRCFSHLQVSDSGMSLFGFSDEDERALFLEIMQVKTMGGRLSIALLRHLEAPAIVSAILTENPSRLAVPGLGPKRAERICFELRAKVEKKFAYMTGEDAFSTRGAKSSLDAGVILGLTGLGFSQNEALKAVASAKAAADSLDGGTVWTEESLLMSALAQLRRK